MPEPVAARAGSRARIDARRTLGPVRTRTALAAFAAVIACAACGSSGSSRRAPEGASLFTEDCAMCHSLTGRQSPRLQGGDLLDLHTTRADMLEFVREMPVRHALTAAQIAAVADYVRAVEARGK
jgi:mono/diheme cytochrome c family protein